ncbi:LLM class flavin-dependent oxidoreductase [Nonomuraea terrae]|uniref:LLM class flavin-dependent oxidoreductase n=1 Tax=Nonomuraea terrae TaxID=2530383 RepID=A0A4R4Z824_9ACTN|nr:LLM class flavin-dependent oxidoreductase [Nonomuraea terrae]
MRFEARRAIRRAGPPAGGTHGSPPPGLHSVIEHLPPSSTRPSLRLTHPGVSLLSVGSSRSAWRARVREVEDLGYDVLQVPDHLGMVAPFPALVAAADVTSMRLATYVLNAVVVSPAYLARDVADTYRLTDGRPPAARPDGERAEPGYGGAARRRLIPTRTISSAPAMTRDLAVALARRSPRSRSAPARGMTRSHWQTAANGR